MADKSTGYIKIYRSILDWEWYNNIDVLCLFLHLMLNASWADGEYHGIKLPRGCMITSYNDLAGKTGLSVQRVRTSISKLKKSGEISVEAHHNYSLIKINKWDEFQGDYRQYMKTSSTEMQKNSLAAFKKPKADEHEQSYDLDEYVKKTMNTVPVYQKSIR